MWNAHKSPQEIKDSVPKKFVKNEKKLKVKGANSYSSGRPGVKKFEWNDFKKKFNDGVSGFVNLVIDHPIWSTVIGVSSVALEEGIRRKLHSKQETALVIYENKSIVGEKYAAFVHKNKLTEDFVINTFFPFMDGLIDNKNFQDDILMEFFELPCLNSFDNFYAQLKEKYCGQRNIFERAFLKLAEYEEEYFMNRKLTFKGCDILKYLFRCKHYEQENFDRIRSHIETLNKFGVEPEFVVYLKYVNGLIDFCVDVIVGKQKMTGQICSFKI